MNQEKFLIREKHSLLDTLLQNGCLAAGLLLACLCMTPLLLLGTGSIITYHDQLDGELLNYLLAARYLFTSIRIYPEIMNGLPAAGAVPPAPLFVLPYLLFRPFTAFLITQWVIYLISFTGMYLLLMRLTRKKPVAFGIAVVFMLLPFYPVYGLCIPGQPLLIFAILSLSSEESASGCTAEALRQDRLRRLRFAHPSGKRLACYLLIALYGAASSPVLVGFACLLAPGAFALFQTLSSFRQKGRTPRSPWIALTVLLLSYLATNPSLIQQVLSSKTTYVSHRTEMVLRPSNFFDSLWTAFTMGMDGTQSYHGVLLFLLIPCALASIYLLFRRPTPPRSLSSQDPAPLSCAGTPRKFTPHADPLPLYKAMGVLAVIFLICLFYAFYSSAFVTGLRNASGGLLKTFNLSRICWLLPTAWCILAGYLLDFLTSLCDAGPQPDIAEEPGTEALPPDAAGMPVGMEAPPDTASEPAIRWKACLKYGTVLVICAVWGGSVLLHSPLRSNVSKAIKTMVLGEEYYALDWRSFFAEDIFSQIETAIGRPKDSYHVVSIGIYPAAALYNGFYCLDGYSNNYPLAYKHAFRRIIADELNKNEYIRDLFDNWGNRCYITTAEQNNYYTFEKKWNTAIRNLDLNMDKLRELDCQYIFSAAYLQGAEEKGLSLLREAPFEAEGSWYHIYVYAVK